MPRCWSIQARLAALAFVLVMAAPALAEPEPAVSPSKHEETQSAFHADIEIDPTAYVLSGFSLHAGIGYGHIRVDLGNYALMLPQFVHGDDGFDLSFDGYGAKVQWFPFAEQEGLFAGVDGGISRILASRQGTDLAKRYAQVNLGIHAGYRISLPANFYVTPWIGIDYAFGAKNVTLAGATTKAQHVIVFPAVHLGYRFR